MGQRKHELFKKAKTHNGYKIKCGYTTSVCLTSRRDGPSWTGRTDGVTRLRQKHLFISGGNWMWIFTRFFCIFFSLARCDCESVCFPSAGWLLQLITDAPTDGLHLLLFYGLSAGLLMARSVCNQSLSTRLHLFPPFFQMHSCRFFPFLFFFFFFFFFLFFSPCVKSPFFSVGVTF